MTTATKRAPKKRPVTPDLFASAPTSTEQLLKAAGVRDGDKAPEQRLGVTPKILNESDLENAVQWIAWLRSRETTVKEKTKQAKALIDETAAKDLSIEIDGEKVAIADYIAKLWKACLDFSGANREQLFGDTKTKKLAHGTLHFAFKPESIGFDGTEAELVDRLIGELRLRKAIADLQAQLDRTKILKITVGLNRDGIKAAVAAGTLKLEKLEALGLRLDREEDFKVKT